MVVNTVAVIGARSLGASLALYSARAGFRTILEDIVPASLRRASHEVQTALAAEVACGALTAAAAEQSLARIEFATSVEEAARQADLVIEAVPDECESKLEIVVFLDKLCRPGTILATTATCLTVADLAAMTFRPDRVVGLLFVPEAGARLTLTVVAGPGTSAKTMASLLALSARQTA